MISYGIFFVLASLLSVDALSNLAPPKKLPPSDSLLLRDCSGQNRRIDGTTTYDSSSTQQDIQKPLVLMFLDADSTFSKENFEALNNIALKYPGIQFTAILSFGLGFNREVCHEAGTPNYYTGDTTTYTGVTLLLDRHNFYNGKFAYEYFAVGSNEVLLYTVRKERFRYLPYTQADLSKALGRTWVITAIEELSRVSGPAQTLSTNVIHNPLYLTDEFEAYPRSTVGNAGVVGKMVAATDIEACKRQCLQSSCTGFVEIGLHECIFFASHGRALKHLKERYDNARLYVRRPVSNVLATQQAFQGFLWGIVIILVAVIIFVCASKVNTRRSTDTILNNDTSESSGITALMKVDDESLSHDKFGDREEAAE